MKIHSIAAVAFATTLSFCLDFGARAAEDCPGNPEALGTARTIVVDPRAHDRIGTMDYAESLPLQDREVVLTFDDGPIPPHTTRVLETLAKECVKATWFIVGVMAREYPALVRRAFDEGHTIGTHSMTHPMRFRALSSDRGNAQIDDGIEAVAAALGESRPIAPFFRFPGFGHTLAAHIHAAERGLMVWGADVPADDWHRLGPNEVARRAVQRLEHKGRGILLLHDIHHRTAEALPLILRELKERGFKVVHVVPASPDRPATVTAAADWRRLGGRGPSTTGSSPNAPESTPSATAFAAVDIALVNGAELAAKSPAELCGGRPEPIVALAKSPRRRHPLHAMHARAEAPHVRVSTSTPDRHAVQ